MDCLRKERWPRMKEETLLFLTLCAPLQDAIDLIDAGELDRAKALLRRTLDRAKALGAGEEQPK